MKPFTGEGLPSLQVTTDRQVARNACALAVNAERFEPAALHAATQAAADFLTELAARARLSAMQDIWTMEEAMSEIIVATRQIGNRQSHVEMLISITHVYRRQKENLDRHRPAA